MQYLVAIVYVDIMSTRYVWEKFEKVLTPSYTYSNELWYVSKEGNDSSEGAGGVYYSTSFTLTGKTRTKWDWWNGVECTFYEAKFSNPSYTSSMTSSTAVPIGNYFAADRTFYVGDSNFKNLLDDAVSYDGDGSEDNPSDALLDIYHGFDSDTGESLPWSITLGYYQAYATQVYSPYYAAIVTSGQGSSLGYVSSSSNTKPSGDYYWSFKGSDNIDPTAIKITTSNLTVGGSCTIQITAGTGKKYSGTVSYVIQYSVNNGSSWSTLTTTTSTSYTFTLSGSMSQLKVRAYAKDNLGFTSSTYVTSSNYSVTSYTTYVGVSGASRGASVKTGVSGVVRSATPKKGVSGVVKS